MIDAKPIFIPLTTYFKLSTDMSPKIEEEIEQMSTISYSSLVDSIIYAIVCTRFEISHLIISIMSRYMVYDIEY